MQHQFKDSGAEALVIVDMFADKLDGILRSTAIRKVIVAEVPQFFSRVPRGGHPRRDEAGGTGRCRRSPSSTCGCRWALAEGAVARRRGAIDVGPIHRGLGPETLALLQYTGGTTGVSQGRDAHPRQPARQPRAGLRDGLQPHRRRQGGGAHRPAAVSHLRLHLQSALLLRRGARNVLVPSPRPIQQPAARLRQLPDHLGQRREHAVQRAAQRGVVHRLSAEAPEGRGGRRRGAAARGGRALAARHRHA
jgi:long-chain acyl-CoA synthetase